MALGEMMAEIHGKVTGFRFLADKIEGVPTCLTAKTSKLELMQGWFDSDPEHSRVRVALEEIYSLLLVAFPSRASVRRITLGEIRIKANRSLSEIGCLDVGPHFGTEQARTCRK
jgi:hypothetical protein